ncbi:MAG: DNA-processing protein DprA, partial [Candidatus Levybacteria bacterium]|nr:DNA-processing protein DprA [Candidatus Levybacteria bacterium]
GALITAEFGLSYGRKVFAVPGPITSSLSKGPYKLIEKGAMLVTKPEHILKELRITNNKLRIDTKKKLNGDTKEEQMIIDLLQNEPFSFDDIVRSTKTDSRKVASLLSMMEIKGLVKSTDTGGFSIATREQ